MLRFYFFLLLFFVWLPFLWCKGGSGTQTFEYGNEANKETPTGGVASQKQQQTTNKKTEEPKTTTENNKNLPKEKTESKNSEKTKQELEGRVEELERQYEELMKAVLAINRTVDSLSHPNQQPQSLRPAAHVKSQFGFPKYYKIKEITYEKKLLNFFLYESFDVYAGEHFLGVFRQSLPLVRLFYDEMCFYDDQGEFRGQLYYGLLRWLGPIPTFIVGYRYMYLYDSEGNLLAEGHMEYYLKAMFSGEGRALDFVDKNGIKYKSRKTNLAPGNQRWHVLEAKTGDKAATIEESTVKDMFDRRFSGWTVTSWSDELDPIIPGFLSAFDLAEAQDPIPSIMYSTIAVSLLIIAVPCVIRCRYF